MADFSVSFDDVKSLAFAWEQEFSGHPVTALHHLYSVIVAKDFRSITDLLIQSVQSDPDAFDTIVHAEFKIRGKTASLVTNQPNFSRLDFALRERENDCINTLPFFQKVRDDFFSKVDDCLFTAFVKADYWPIYGELNKPPHLNDPLLTFIEANVRAGKALEEYLTCTNVLLRFKAREYATRRAITVTEETFQNYVEFVTKTTIETGPETLTSL